MSRRNTEELTEFQKAVILALAEACDFSPHAHPPENAILSKFDKHLRGDVRTCLKFFVPVVAVVLALMVMVITMTCRCSTMANYGCSSINR